MTQTPVQKCRDEMIRSVPVGRTSAKTRMDVEVEEEVGETNQLWRTMCQIVGNAVVGTIVRKTKEVKNGGGSQKRVVETWKVSSPRRIPTG
jgi:hypothetical protein